MVNYLGERGLKIVDTFSKRPLVLAAMTDKGVVGRRSGERLRRGKRGRATGWAAEKIGGERDWKFFCFRLYKKARG